VVKAIADGEMSINKIVEMARKEILKDVEYYKKTGEFREVI